jgi:hypothetical protein
VDNKVSISNKGKLFPLYQDVQTYVTEIQTFKLKINFNDTQGNKYPQVVTLVISCSLKKLKCYKVAAVAMAAYLLSGPPLPDRELRSSGLLRSE